MLPPFDENGLLPPGDHRLTLVELQASYLVAGPGGGVPWAAKWRRKLVDNLAVMVNQLWTAGIDEIFINGSFVEDVAKPNDIDGYFVCKLFDISSGDLQRKLNAQEPSRCWTWDDSTRRPHPSSTKAQLPMWHQYRVELYPHTNLPRFGSRVKDSHGNELSFPSLFHQQRDSELPKGNVQIVRPSK